jgi:hypothetical protein
LRIFIIPFFSSSKQHSMVTGYEFKDGTLIHFFWGRCNYGATRVVFSSFFYVGPYGNTGDFELPYERYWRGGEWLFQRGYKPLKRFCFTVAKVNAFDGVV